MQSSMALLAILSVSLTAFTQTFVQTNVPFRDSTGYIRGVSWGDIDGDGDQDVYLSGYAYSGGYIPINRLYINNGSPNFTLLTALNSSLRSECNAFGDLDGDGDLDVMLLKSGSNTEVHSNNGGGAFTISSPIAGSSFYQGGVSLGDYDNDGDLDAYVSRWNNLTDILYRNNGNGTYTSVTSGGVGTDAGWTSNGIWGDMDNDNDLDLYMLNYQGVNNLYINNGNGTFTKSAVAGTVITHNQNSRDGNWVDYDDDGFLDLFVANQGSSNRLYRNNGNGTFTETTPAGIASGTTWSSNWGDYDNDGDQDFMTIGSWNTAHQFMQNNGGTFTAINPGCLPNAGSGSNSTTGLFTDINNDGWLDVHVLFPASVNDFVYFNEGSVCKNWIEFDLVGAASNANGIGAKISIKAATNGTSVWQHRSVTGQSAKVGHQMIRSHFGAGDATIIDSVVIAWPSGATCTLVDVDVNQIVSITEGVCAANPTLGPLPDCIQILPVELVGFEANCEEGVNVLTWQTASETNNDYFVIERSYDGKNFEKVDIISGAGNSNHLINYKWSERGGNEIHYYRLKQVDFDGSYDYSPIRAIDCKEINEKVIVYPNPVNAQMNVLLNDVKNVESISLVDQAGRLVHQFDVNSKTTVYSLDTENISAGLYLLKVVSEFATIEKSVVVN